MGLLDFFQKTAIDDEIKEYRAAAGALLLDVREPYEYTEGHIEHAANVPLGEIQNISSLTPDKSRMIFVYCQSGARSGRAVAALRQMGYVNAKNIGGISSYQGKIIKGE